MHTTEQKVGGSNYENNIIEVFNQCETPTVGSLHPRCAHSYPSSGCVHRHGDLFPLPCVGSWEEPPRRCLGVSRCVLQRRARRIAVCRATAEASAALNDLAGFPDASSWPGAAVNAAQHSALAVVEDAVRSVPRSSSHFLLTQR